MPDTENRTRLNAFEDALNPAPVLAKFSAKTPAPPVPMATLVAQIREQAQATLKLCDEAEQFIAAIDGDARKAADILIGMAARIK